MSATSLRVYHALPAPLRSVAASLHGYRLRPWRFGPETDRLASETIERDHWDAARWKQWQEERLAFVLHRAATRVPYYQEYWSRKRRNGDTRSFEYLEHWPVLHKETLRNNPSAFVADDCAIKTMYADHTSGTTGTPLTIWLSRDSVRLWYALFEARTRWWHGVNRHDRWGHVGGQPVVPPGQKSPPFWVWNAALHQLYLSAMHIAPWSVPAYLDVIKKYRVRYLVGYSSSLSFLGQEAAAAGERFPDLKAVITNAEPLWDHQRRAIREGFQCTVQETYGLCEYVCGGSECTSGRLHLWPEMGTVEILDEDDRPVSPGAPGRLVATGLLNADMPLIRYDTRDRAALSTDTSTCGCGRLLPSFAKIWGRWDDVIVTKDGRRPVLLDRIFDPPVHVREGQIVQDDIGKFRLRIVPADGWSPADEEILRRALIALVGEAEVSFELTRQIERTWAGKFRIIVSNVGKHQP
ncbi:MAG: AMP-binding protein [Bacteroidota bacterium]